MDDPTEGPFGTEAICEVLARTKGRPIRNNHVRRWRAQNHLDERRVGASLGGALCGNRLFHGRARLLSDRGRRRGTRRRP